MRGATACAKRLKLLFSSLRSKLGKVGRPPVTDPITQLILGVLSRDTPEAKAAEGLDRLRTMVVDYNELRVIPVLELVEILGGFPDVRLKCEDISRALNGIFALEHAIALDRLAGLPKKEVIAILECVDGLEAYTRARIRLLGLGQHAIPLDEAMWAWARQQKIVDPRCPLLEAQRFLERQIAEEDAREFVALFRKSAWSEMGTAVRRGEVSRIVSVPPDRTSRNMLQMVSRGASTADERGDTGARPAVVAAQTVPPSRPSRESRDAAPASDATSAPRRRKATRGKSPKRGTRTKAAAAKRKSKTRKAARRPKASANKSRTRAKRSKAPAAGRATAARKTRRAKQSKRGVKRTQTTSASRGRTRNSPATTSARTKGRTKRTPRDVKSA